MERLRAAWRQTWLLTHQTLLDPHRGSLLGVAWLYLLPLVQILIYTFVFSRFMGARLSGVNSAYAYSLYLVPGLLMWNAFANTLNGMVGVYQAKAYLIRKLPVNLIVMPTHVPLVEGINLFMALLLFTFFALLIDHWPLLSWLLLIPVSLSLLLLAYALGLVLAVLSPFLPDLRPMTNIALQLLFWLTPIVYVPDILPSWAGPLVGYHPIYWGIRQAQNLVLYGQLASLRQWLAQWLLAIIILILAVRLVKNLDKDVRDLI